MQVNNIKSKPINSPFQPIKLELVIETAEEAQALYAIFNLRDNRDLLGWDRAEQFLKKLGPEYYIDNSDRIIANSIKYRDFYRAKQ